MASSSSKAAVRLWPDFILNWLKKQVRPNEMGSRVFNEYIAGVGMIQVNEHRRNQGLPVFEFATILTGIHKSDTDVYPHATIAAATKAMRNIGQHIVVHSRVSMDETEFIGSEAFELNVREDHKLLRASYSDPVPARTSLIPQDNGAVLVGHITVDGKSTWYIYGEKEGIVYLEPDVFFRAGEGATEHIQFWNPKQNQICRAVFQGTERPPTRSPDPQPSNLEAAISNLSIASPEPPVEWVKPELKLDKHRSKPLGFSTKAGLDMRTGWEQWKAQKDGRTWAFVCVGLKTGNEYWAEYLPGEWIEPVWKKSSERPIQFYNEAGQLVKTTPAQWLPGRENTFFAYLEQGAVYLTTTNLSNG